jgi:isopentenyl-diphosphate delta-isomerase
MQHNIPAEDPTAVSRKKDHIDLALKSRIDAAKLDPRFYYEPLFTAHPIPGSLPTLDFAGKILRAPLWVSSMTGGTAMANTINHNLARACREFGMGMGLGSCRQLLYSNEMLPDFDVRAAIGPDQPLFANLGIAQLEQLIDAGETARIEELIGKLQADGLIIHVNPLQEAMQPEGDLFKHPPLETIETVLRNFPGAVIVKEVGQGFGPDSLRALLQLPLAAVEFAAGGGTNFAKLELLRSEPAKQMIFEKIAAVGHSAAQMNSFIHAAVEQLGAKRRVERLIISGGIQHFLDGYYLIQTSEIPAVYGQAAAFLEHAQGNYEDLQTFVQSQIRGLELAYAFLRPVR